jgi:nucleoside 2-deoxyribosyltransferase
MKIYVAHSTAFDYQSELYQPLRQSSLNSLHDIVLPHESTSELYDSKNFLKECDLVIAEVSYPSTGMGIELGWANSYGVEIIALHKSDASPSRSITAVTNKIHAYKAADELISTLERLL